MHVSREEDEEGAVWGWACFLVAGLWASGRDLIKEMGRSGWFQLKGNCFEILFELKIRY